MGGFNTGAKYDGNHYWLTPPKLMEQLQSEFKFTFDACPFPKPDGFNGLEADWGASTYCNQPFGHIVVDGKKMGPTAWARKALAAFAKSRGGA